MTIQIVRDWVIKVNADGPDSLIGREAPGKPPLLTTRIAPHRMLSSRALRSRPFMGRAIAIVDLRQQIFEKFRFGLRADPERELRAIMPLPSRPGAAQDRRGRAFRS
jgi:hypothetical protein